MSSLPGLILLALLTTGCLGAERAPEPPILSRTAAASPLAAIPIASQTRHAEMPWVWRVLKREVYARLPRVASHAHRDRRAVFAPMIVDGPDDSVPGVGVEGGF